VVLKPKEKKEIGIVFAAVFLVVAIGLLLSYMGDKKISNMYGAATTLVFNSPDNSGTLSLLNERCAPISGNGNCDIICGSKVCVPLERNCYTPATDNQCYCCEVPQK